MPAKAKPQPRKAPITKPLTPAAKRAQSRKRKPQAPAPVPRLLYSISEAAEALGYGRRKVQELVTSGALRSIKDGQYRKIPHHCLEEYIDGLLSMAG